MLRSILRDTVWWIKKVPCTIILILASLVAGIVTKALWISADSSGLSERIGYGLPAFKDGDFLSIISGALVAPAPWMYILILLPLGIGAGYLEYKHGALRMLAAVLATHVGAVLLVALMLQLLSGTSLVWAQELSRVRDVGLSNAGFGALGAMTAALTPLWRRRIRTSLFLYCFAFLLFSGLIWDLTHFTSLLLGIAIGPWVVGRSIQPLRIKVSKQELRNFAAVLVVFYAITRLVSKLYPGNGGLLAFHNFDPTHSGTILFIVGLSVLLLLLAYGLYAGRAVAWRLTVASSLFILLGSLLLPSNATVIFNQILTALVLIILLTSRHAFDVKPDKLVRKTVYKRLVFVAGGLFVFNALAIYAIRSSFSPTPSFFEALGESVYQIIGVSTRSFAPNTGTAEALTYSISISWLAFVFISLFAIIFTTYRGRGDRSSFDTYDKLMREKGCSSIGWMARWNGMSYWANASKTAAFAYRLENNFAIVLSDPVGSRQAVAASFTSFEAMCLRRGWHPIYFSVSDTFRNAVAQQHLKSIIVGEDTIIDLPELTMSGKAWQSVRSAVNRAHKDGINMRVIKFSEAPIGLQDQLRSIAHGWVADKSLPEMGFTLGTLIEAEDLDVRMHIAVDQDGTVHGMTSWFPIFKSGKIVGWTIDIMQRRLDAHTMPGVIEFLIAESATTFKQEGYQYISLSAAPLSHEGKASNAIEKLLDVVAERMEPYYGFKSLYNYKKKFNPRHEPMYLCYHDEVRLPAIAIAIGKAYMPENTIRHLLAASIAPRSSKK